MIVKSKWHKTQIKTTEEIASALAFNTWRITKNHLEDLINEAFVIEKPQVFAVIKEYLCFLIACTDRLLYAKLNTTERIDLITRLVKQSADYYQENKAERIGEGDHYQAFIDYYNQLSADYAAYQFNGTPDYHFLRYFAEKIQKSMTAADEKWIVQQIIEIQAPKAFKSIAKSVDELTAVKQIILKSTTPNPPKNKIPRSKRKQQKIIK